LPDKRGFTEPSNAIDSLWVTGNIKAVGQGFIHHPNQIKSGSEKIDKGIRN